MTIACVRFLNALEPTKSGFRVVWRAPDVLRICGDLKSHVVDVHMLNGWVSRIIVGMQTSTTNKIPDDSSMEYLKILAQECREFLETP